jgi:hypothetical protein
MATYINTKSSVFALMVESTQSTPVVPSAATDYIAEQDDFTMASSFEQLENMERLASLGKAKTIIGMESATANMSHYLRAGGTTGVAPAYANVIKSLLGVQTDVTTEDDTVAGSTTTALNVDTGEGALRWARGHCARVQDSVNGHTIAPVHSVTGDALTLGFALDVAPAAGVNLGKRNVFSPLETGLNQTLTLWEYMGNGGAVRMVSGARCVSMDIEFTAGQLINASYGFEGIRMYMNPVQITASNKYIDFDDGGGEESAALTEDWYATPHDLAAAAQTACDALSSDTITVDYSDVTGKFTFASDGGTFELLAKTGTHGSDNTDTHAFVTLGFVDTADYTLATTYTSDNAMTLTSPYTPSYDSNIDPLVAKCMTVRIGDQEDNENFSCSAVSVSIATPASDIMDVTACTGKLATLVTARTVTLSVTCLLTKYEADKFYRMTQNKDTRALLVAGSKTNASWDAGKTVAIYLPTTTVSNVQNGESDGLYELTFDLNTYIDGDGNGDVYINFL